jgi:hypothetical protein
MNGVNLSAHEISTSAKLVTVLFVYSNLIIAHVPLYMPRLTFAGAATIGSKFGSSSRGNCKSQSMNFCRQVLLNACSPILPSR